MFGLGNSFFLKYYVLVWKRLNWSTFIFNEAFIRKKKYQKETRGWFAYVKNAWSSSITNHYRKQPCCTYLSMRCYNNLLFFARIICNCGLLFVRFLTKMWELQRATRFQFQVRFTSSEAHASELYHSNWHTASCQRIFYALVCNVLLNVLTARPPPTISVNQVKNSDEASL